uniref:TRPM SLOG domain-containing protein n=1 Tax=Plectus sambesii TaxID=2011161 RepID=A0A914W1B9_9BILA
MPGDRSMASDSERGDDDVSIREARCFFHRRKIGIELDGRRPSPTDDVSQERHELIHIKNKLSVKECICYVPVSRKQARALPDLTLSDVEPPCHCGAIKSEHYQYNSPSIKSNSVNASEWSEETAITEVPCNSFGEIEFASDEARAKPAKYVRLSNSTPISDVVEMMTNGWKILEPHRPGLVISVIGGAKNFEFDGESREVFNRGLVRAAHATNAWMITSGSNMGVMMAVGEAMKEGHTVAFGGSRMKETLTCIGVAHWGTVKNRKDLISSDGGGCWPATYHVDPVIRQGKPVSLDPNHTHFILVDDGYSKYVQPTVAKFRAKLEQKIAANENGGLTVPVVVVLIEGGLDTLDAVCEYLKCQIPVVICQGTGRAADILSYAKLSCVEEINLNTGKVCRLLPEEHRIAVMQMLTEAYSGSMKMDKQIVQEKLAEILQRVELCCQQDDLITLCDIDSNEDLDVAILTALLDGHDTRPIDQLHLALKWNRADVAAEKIFTKYDMHANVELDELMTEALATNKIDFVQLLLLRGVDIKNYLTVNRLRYLYNTCPPDSFIYDLLGSVAQKRTKYFLCDVKVVLEQQIGWKMDDVYALDSEEATQSHLDRQKKSVESIEYNDSNFDEPFKELFFWAVLVNRPTLARFFWECTEHPIMNALVASKIYSSMSERASVSATSHLADHFVKLAREYEAHAKNVIDQAYEFDSDKALLIVEMPHEQWDQLNCMQMAALAFDKNFMASTCSQMWLDQVWRHGIKCTELEAVVGLLCPFYVLFRMQFDESIIGATRKQLSLYQRYKVFIASPLTKFSTFTVSWIVFLTLYSYVVVFALRPGTIYYPEMVLHIWVTSLFIDKIRMALIFLLSKDGETRYLASSLVDLFFTPFFYKLDMVLLGLHATGCCLRWLPPEYFDVTRVVFCLAAATAFSRLFRVYMAHPFLGPKLFVIRQMIADVIMFLIILVVFMLAYSVCAQALLFPDRDFYWGIFIDTFYYPYWQLYGELSLDNTIEGNTRRLHN